MAVAAAALEQRHRTRVTDVALPGARSIALLHPANADELIREDEFVADGRLPYWADLWPAARVLAAHLAALEGNDRPLLEIGCGSGLVASAAAMAGFDVTATDYYEDACAFARVNAWRASGRTIATRLLDWRHLPADLGQWDIIVASDVLYELPYAALVAETLARVLSADGLAWIADPGRSALDAFLSAARHRGLDPGEPTLVSYDLDGQKQVIRLFTVRHAGAAARSRAAPAALA